MTSDSAMEVVDIRECTSWTTNVVSGAGHIVREEADGVFLG